MRPRTILGVTFVAALVVFAAVQDRVTAGGARQYAALQRLALSGQSAFQTIDEVMTPAVRLSVRDGLVGFAALMAGGLVTAFLVSRSGFRKGPE